MPELPEVECVRRTLLPRWAGRTVRRVVIARPGYARAADGPADARSLLSGGVLEEIRRHGKQLALIARDGRALTVHLGMTGSLRWWPPGAEHPPDRHEHLAWQLDDGSRVAMSDPRRFGRVRAFRTCDALISQEWAGLGVDALSVRGGDLAVALAGTRRAVKAVLLDQSVLAGVGNIYADESLFAAGICPTRPGRRVRGGECVRLADAIRRTLARAIARGGSTLADGRYVDADGRRGSVRHGVYGRGGLPCVACGHPLRRVVVAQRTTVYCANCQK